MEFRNPNEDLLQEFLNGDSSEESLHRLTEAAAEDPSLASRLASELEFSELIRQSFSGAEVFAAETFKSALHYHELTKDELIEKACEGSISREQSDQLVKMLWEDPAAAKELRDRLAFDEWLREAVSGPKREEAFLESLETRMWAETKEDHFVEDFTERLEQEIAAQEEATGNIVPMPPAFSRKRTTAQMTGVAAAIAVGAFFLVQQFTGGIGTEKSVATVAKSSIDAEWSNETLPGDEGEILPGRYELKSGVVSLQFVSGGEMTVEGPAVFTVAEDESAFMYRGLAMAKAGDSKNGISLQSKGLRVSESVPLMGIDARGEHSTAAIAFSGDGGVCLPDGGKCRSLFEMEAVKADLIRDKFVAIPFDPEPFSKTWELLAGVEKNMGSVRIEPPGTKIEASDSLDGKNEVQVFVENDSFHPDHDLEVDQIQLGEFAGAETNPGQALQAGGELRSYLLQLWPSEGSDGEEVEASLTFDHPIVGVIYSSDRLAESDHSVGTSITHVGEEFNSGRGLDSGSDQILLSDDRRTINLKLNGGDLEVDQIRVLVALN